MYLFAHMGEQFLDINKNTKPYTVPEIGPNIDTKLSYSTEYETKTSEKRYPQGPENAIKVRAGDWLGKVGNRGKNNGGAHIHLEVYEYFTNAIDKKGAKWQRVEPLSVFDERLFDISYREDGVQKVKKTYGWWSRKRGDAASFAVQAEEYSTLKAKDGASVMFKSWYGTAFNEWISVRNYADFPNTAGSTAVNRFENVFIPDAWEQEKQPGYEGE